MLTVTSNTANPDDMKAICVTNTKQVQSQISNKCGATAQSALQFYSNTCQEYGHKVGKDLQPWTPSYHVKCTFDSWLYRIVELQQLVWLHQDLRL